MRPYIIEGQIEVGESALLVYGLPEYQVNKLGSLIVRQLDALYACRSQYPVEVLEDYSKVYSACKVGGNWRIVTDCNPAFDLGGYTFYPHLCDGRPRLAEAMAKSVCFWLNLFGGVTDETVPVRGVWNHSYLVGGVGSRG